MITHTPAPIRRDGHRVITTESGNLLFEVFSGAVGIDEADANEERLVTVWNSHDQLVTENAALREQLARKDAGASASAPQLAVPQGWKAMPPELDDFLLRAAHSGFRPALNKMTGQDSFVIRATYDALFQATPDAAPLPDPVREQLVAALKIGRDVMALVGVQDHLVDYDAVSKGRKIVVDALAAAGAGAALVGMDSPASANAGGQV